MLHEGSNLKFAGDYVDTSEIIDDVTIMSEGTVLNVCASIWVGCWYQGELIKFYVQDVREIPQMFKLVSEAGANQVHVGMTIDSFNSVVDTLEL